MLLAADAQRLQALEVALLGIAGIGLEDDLQLRVHLHPIGVLGVATVVGPVRRLDVGHVPRLRPQDAEEGRRVHRPGADLLTVGQPDQGALVGPVALQAQEYFLKSQHASIHLK